MADRSHSLNAASKKTGLTLIGKLGLATTVLLWASAFVGIRAGLHGYSPGSLALLRYGIASIVMLVLYLSLPKRCVPRWRELPNLLAIGIGGIAIYNIALNYGEITVTAGIAGFIVSLMPIFTIFLSAVFLRENISQRMTAGVIMSFIGITLIAFGEGHAATIDHGVFLVLIAPIMGSVYTVAQKPLLRRYHPLEVTAFAVWIGTLFMLIYLPQLSHDIRYAPAVATYWVIYLGIFPAAIAYAAWSYTLTELPASKAASYLYFMPFITTLMGWLWLNEIPHWLALAGGLIAMAGAYVATRKAK